MSCPQVWRMAHLRDAILTAPDMDLPRRLQYWHELKAACECFERCDWGVDQIIEAARQRGELA